MDWYCSPPGSSVHEVARQEWVPMPSSRESFQLRDGTQISCIAGGFFFYYLSHQGSPYKIKPVSNPENGTSHCSNSAEDVSADRPPSKRMNELDSGTEAVTWQVWQRDDRIENRRAKKTAGGQMRYERLQL